MVKYQEAISHYKYGISHDIFKEPVTTYAKLTVEALEKQVPKKIVIKHVQTRCLDLNELHCPTCKKFFGFSHTTHQPYCNNCGQALDWSNVNE